MQADFFERVVAFETEGTNKKSAPTKVDAPKNALLPFATTQIIWHITRNAQIENAFICETKNILLQYALFDLCGEKSIPYISIIVNYFPINYKD
ncbi:MAG: hypothetical protein IJB48_04975 [Clostridia bacterium]|nr:hypothetical protein [Clostridia bacterium]MBQ3553738.1 hypothetical protein [Clostridia bacterium]